MMTSRETAEVFSGPRGTVKYAVEAIGTLLRGAQRRHQQAPPDNSFYGMAIGFTVVAGAFAVGAISGGAFNPAVSLGAAVMGLFAWPTLWVYVLAQVVAGVAAGVSFLSLNPDDK